MTDEDRRARLERLTAASQRLLTLIEEIRELEQQKRAEPVGSPQFLDLAERARLRSREVFQLAAGQQEQGEPLDEDTSLDDASARQSSARPTA